MLRSIEATDSFLCYLHLIDFQQPNSYFQPSNLIELPFVRKQLVIKYTFFLFGIVAFVRLNEDKPKQCRVNNIE